MHAPTHRSSQPPFCTDVRQSAACPAPLVHSWRTDYFECRFELPTLAIKRKLQLAATIGKAACTLQALKAGFEAGDFSAETKTAKKINERMAAQRRAAEKAYSRYLAWNDLVRSPEPVAGVEGGWRRRAPSGFAVRASPLTHRWSCPPRSPTLRCSCESSMIASTHRSGTSLQQWILRGLGALSDSTHLSVRRTRPSAQCVRSHDQGH